MGGGLLRHAHRFTGLSALRAGGLACQWGFVLLIVEWGGDQSSGEFFTLVAVASLFAALADFGFVTYSFRLARRTAAWRVYRAALEALFMGILLGLPIVIGYLVWAGLPLSSGLSIQMTIILFGMVALCRNSLILQQRYMAAVGLEAAIGPFQVALLAVTVLIVGTDRLGLGTMTAIYILSVALTAALGLWLSHGGADWMRAVRGLSLRPAIGPTWRRLRRSFPLCLSFGAYNVWLNLPILWLGLISDPREVATLGIYMRAIGAVRALAGSLVVQIQNLAYTRPTRARILAMLMSTLALTLVAALILAVGGMALVAAAAAGWGPAVALMRVDAVAMLVSLPTPAVLALPVVILYAVLSILLMGWNRLRSLAGATLACVVMQVVLFALSPALMGEGDRIGIAVLSLLVSGGLAVLIMGWVSLRADPPPPHGRR
ncbi:MAG: hypothetical protein RLY86_639 [Pseudomonadota bacterium]|jgi:hypothetical protein